MNALYPSTILRHFGDLVMHTQNSVSKSPRWIFVDQIKVDASKAVHVGDDKKADKAGANAVGIECW